MTDNFPTK